MDPREQLTCRHCGNRFPRSHPVGRRPIFCPDHNTARKRAASPAKRHDVELPLEARLKLLAAARETQKFVDSVRPSVEPMRLGVEAMRSQLSWLDKDLSGLVAVKGLGALTADQKIASLAQFEPIGARFAREIGNSVAALKVSVPEWPPPGLVTGLSLFGEQTKLLSDSIGVGFFDAQFNLASAFTAVSRTIDLDIASKFAGLDTGRLFALLGDDGETDTSVVDEVADELGTDQSQILAARTVLRAVVGLMFDGLSEADGWAREGARIFDEQLNALKDAHGDNPYLWLISHIFTAVTAYQVAVAIRNRTGPNESTGD